MVGLRKSIWLNKTTLFWKLLRSNARNCNCVRTLLKLKSTGFNLIPFDISIDSGLPLFCGGNLWKKMTRKLSIIHILKHVFSPVNCSRCRLHHRVTTCEGLWTRRWVRKRNFTFQRAFFPLQFHFYNKKNWIFFPWFHFVWLWLFGHSPWWQWPSRHWWQCCSATAAPYGVNHLSRFVRRVLWQWKSGELQNRLNVGESTKVQQFGKEEWRFQVSVQTGGKIPKLRCR